MGPRDHEAHDEHQGADSPPGSELANGNGGPSTGPQVIATDDPVIMSAPAPHPDWTSHPDRTMVVETNRISEPDQASIPHIVKFPVPYDRPRHARSDAGDVGKKASESEQERGRKGRAEQDENAKKNQSNPKQDRDHDWSRSGDRRQYGHGQSVQAFSWTRMVLIPGVVALVCGIVGAGVYWHYFGSGDQKSSSKDSDSSKSSNASENADSSKEDSDNGKLHQAQAAWKSAVKELRQAQAAERSARRSEEETKAILEFFKKNLLSAGRPGGDFSLAQAFWAGGHGNKDLTLRKAVDVTDSQVAEAFADRPLGEATVRQMLGFAYLSLGEAAQGVKQYERALALREAMQGVNDPDTADCRNQLAIAYRLAGRTGEASSLFDRNAYSPAHASALAARGSTLLFEKKPAEAELKLRECLTVRQKMQPDDWTTFDTKSILGEALLDQKKFAESEPLLLSGYEGMKLREDMIPSRDKPRLTRAIERLARLYEAWGKDDKAMRWRSELETAVTKTF